MSNHTKTFDYQVEGLSYTVTVYEENGAFFADIFVNEGQMDVNAVYYGDDDMSGSSAKLAGPLNMNGGGSTYEGEKVQWDEADILSQPGLGPEGEEKETFVSEGDTLTISLSLDSLEDIEFFGIRATSTSTDEGSIKAVSGDPETPEEPEEPEDDPTYDKVFFVYEFNESQTPIAGFNILSEEPETNEFNIPSLPEGTEPTFENYVTYFEEISGDVTQIESVLFYTNDENDVPQISFGIEAPEGGFQSSEELLSAYDLALEELEAGSGEDSNESADLLQILSLEPLSEELPQETDSIEEDSDEFLAV